MKKIITKKDMNVIYILGFVYGSSMIFYELIPKIVTIVFSLLFVFYTFNKLKKDYDSFISIYMISVLMIPTSFVSVLSTSFSDFPLPWLYILILIMVFMIIKNKRINKNFFSPFILFLLFGIIIAIIQPNITDALKQLLTILLFLLTFLIGENIKRRDNLKKILNISYYLYLVSALSVGSQIIIQKIYIESTDIIIGNYAKFGGDRIAYGGLMGDYSFATVYLMSGFFLGILMYISWHKISFFRFILIEAYLLTAAVSVSSRTGIYAFIITFALFFCFQIQKKKMKLSYIVILIAVIILIPIIFSILKDSRGAEVLFDGSGRGEGYIQGLQNFADHIIIGNGLGLENLNVKTGLTVPHNFFIQYLTQIGLLGTGLLCYNFKKFIINYLFESGENKWLFVLIIISAMAIPDILASRFIYGIIIIVMLSGYCDSLNRKYYPKNESGVV